MDTLLKELLTNLVYSYYPVNTASSDFYKYESSPEYSNLKRTCEYFASSNYLDTLAKEISRFFYPHKVFNTTLLNWLDRSFNFSVVIENNEKFLTTFNLYISILIPYYTFNTTVSEKVGNTNLLYPPSIRALDESNKFSQIEKNFFDFLNDLGYKDFPKDILNETISNVEFKDITLGSFTFFNAFFRDDYENRF